MYDGRNGFKQAEIAYLAVVRYLDIKTIQPSNTLHKSRHCYCPRLAIATLPLWLSNNANIEQLPLIKG